MKFAKIYNTKEKQIRIQEITYFRDEEAMQCWWTKNAKTKEVLWKATIKG